MKLLKFQSLLKKELKTTRNNKKREFLGNILASVENSLILEKKQAKREINIFKN
jgi:hypothetical protein